MKPSKGLGLGVSSATRNIGMLFKIEKSTQRNGKNGSQSIDQ